MGKVAQINATCGKGSTGKIVIEVSELLTKENIENYILYTSGESNYPFSRKYAKTWEIKAQALRSRVLGEYGFNSKRITKRLIAELEKIAPNVVYLHNIHGHDCHLKTLFTYFKEKKIKLYWTFHDCWAFTAYCPYFDIVECDQWKTGCEKCPQRKIYSWFFDKSKKLYQWKKELFLGLDLTVITPSEWLTGLVKESFFKDYPVKVIHNGIDLSVFQPTESNFREKYGLQDKFILLGVAFGWGERKGLDVFIELSKRLGQEYQIVLVGTNERVEKDLPKNIISIRRTQNQKELAEIYTVADLFVNPTREENYPTVNMESLACGTPIVTFKTGGSPEIIDETCGIVVEKNDVDGLVNAIRGLKEKPFAKEACLERAKSFDKNERFKEYVELIRRD